MNYSALIKKLLESHDCVVIPGLGGFVANPHSARLDQLRERIHPPFKEIGFNSRLIKNDGLLVKEIELLEGSTYSEAEKTVSIWKDDIKEALKQKNQYDFEGIGLLYHDLKGNLRFKQEKNSSLSRSSFGLSFVAAKPINPISEKERPTPSQANVVDIARADIEKTDTPASSTNDTEIRQSQSLPWRHIAAASILIPLLLYSIWIPTGSSVFSGNEFQMSDLNPFQESICPYFEKRPELPELKQKPEESAILRLPSKNLLDQQYFSTSFFEKGTADYDPGRFVTIKLRNLPTEISTTHVAGSYSSKYPGMKYFIVGGCFSIESNAVNFVKTLRAKGYEAAVVDIYKGLFRVAVSGFESKASAKAELESIRQAGFEDAWIARIKT